MTATNGPHPMANPHQSTDLVIGLVGCGKIARDQHIPAIAATGGLHLAAIADPYATHPAVPSYPDLAAMLAAHPEIGAVALCQPPQARFAAAREAIRAGRHVMLEKPPGGTVSEAEALVALARDAGVSLFTAWHSREAAGVAAARQWLRSKVITRVHIAWKEDVRVWHPGQRWIAQPGGFGVFDPGINALSILTALIPDAIRVLRADLVVPANWQTPIAAQIAMETADGVPIAAEFDFRQTGSQVWTIAFETTAGDAALADGGATFSAEGVLQPAAGPHEYPALYRHFAQLVRTGQCAADLRPLQLVADAFLCGRASATAEFDY